jgi:hypothetical protein
MKVNRSDDAPSPAPSHAEFCDAVIKGVAFLPQHELCRLFGAVVSELLDRRETPSEIHSLLLDFMTGVEDAHTDRGEHCRKDAIQAATALPELMARLNEPARKGRN